MIRTLFAALFTGTTFVHGGYEYQTLPSSCRLLEDGEHYVQPLTTEELRQQTGDDTIVAHPIHVFCSNGYMVIDPIKDENVQLYFSSFHKYHYAFAGPDLNDHVVWKDWFLPSRYDSSINKYNEDSNGITGSYFTISDNCQTCTQAESASYPYETAFYMTGDLFGCNWSNKNLCGFDLDTLECQICTNTFFDDEIMSDWGSCGHLPTQASHSVHEDHDQCSTNGYMLMPSIGVTSTEESNKFCVCYQPSERVSSYFETNTQDFDMTTELNQDYSKIDDLFDNDAKRIVRLSQSDFEYGTYRITRPGKYTLTEDIVLDFNCPKDDDLLMVNEDYSINDDESAYFPRSEQASEYPGATELDGWYWLGFYAGITIEADDVILDLNGHSIGMSYAFYLQQRWFVTVLIANKPFIDTQGPTWTGAGFLPASRTLIKNGVIGLSSHHGILALNATDCVIEDVHIKDFETHGLAVNEFHNLQLSNVEIGPSSRYVYLNGMYNLARMELPILRSAYEDYGSTSLEFLIPKVNGKRKRSFGDLYERLIKQMDYAFNYVYNDISYDDSYEDYSEFKKAIELFVNPTGISPHGVVYGAVFRPRGASIQNFGRLLDVSTKSENLIVDNLNIHDLAVDVKEYFAMQGKTERWVRDPINGVLPLSDVTIGFDGPLDDLVYVGNAWTDIIIALKSVTSDWWHLGRMSMSDEIVTWALSGERLGIFYKTTSSTPRYCNMDALGHLVKGMLGIRMEWVTNVKMSNVEIHDLFSLSDLGNSDLCGEYVGSGHPVQSAYSNPGYGGINTYGMMLYEVNDAIFDSLNIENLVSYNGPTVGVKQFYMDAESSSDSDASEDTAEPQVTLKNVQMSNFFAGTQLTGTSGKETSWPNTAARACGFAEDDKYYSLNNDYETLPQVNCLSGKASCMCGSNSCYGEYAECDSVATVTTPYHTIEANMGEFVNIENDDYSDLTISENIRPSKLIEILNQEPQRIEIEISDDSNGDSDIEQKIMKKMMMPKRDSTSELNVKIGEIATIDDKEAIWMGISLLLITFSLLILYTYTKCEMGAFDECNWKLSWQSMKNHNYEQV